ncbi:hypothetical protein, partial [Pasteurella multocida]|uniref:hypothetical protein n=1 Tax=Pasteurella multocida TaxID=747 RepID=UPI0035E43896
LFVSLQIVNDLSCYLRFLPNKGGLLVGGAVYEFFADQWIAPEDRSRTRRAREPITGEAAMMLRPPLVFPRPTRRHAAAAGAN